MEVFSVVIVAMKQLNEWQQANQALPYRINKSN